MDAVTLPGTHKAAVEAALEAVEVHMLILAELAEREQDREALYRIWMKASARSRFVEAIVGRIADRVEESQQEPCAFGCRAKATAQHTPYCSDECGAQASAENAQDGL